MNTFIVRRLLQAIPTLFGISLLSFMLMLATPGDPITTITFNPNSNPETTMILRRQLGLDQPPLVQYLYWLIGNDWRKIDIDGDGEGDVMGTRQGVLRGDFGQSIGLKRPVLSIIVERIPATLLLAIPAVLMGYLVGMIIGLLAAIWHNSWFDQLSRVLSVFGSAVPAFWLGLILIIVFSVNLGWLPMGGMRDITKPDVGFNVAESLPYMVMPVLVLALGIIAVVSRYTRIQVLEVLGQDYVRTAYSKGLSNFYVNVYHVARNALIPIITLLGGAIGALLGGAVIIEQVFSWPGLGRLVIEAVSQRDYPLIMGSVVISGFMYIVGLLFSDILYGLIDPRIRLS
ncbi:MAG: ABC transporter permease [Chloroflexi bacterium]|nr:ABC transporter permease [Chloroflexota bacterium]MCC6892661.1 ABC transporter permease [Anaerolineae bacterium]